MHGKKDTADFCRIGLSFHTTTLIEIAVLLPKYKPLVQGQKSKLKLSLWINFVQIPRHFSAGSNL